MSDLNKQIEMAMHSVPGQSYTWKVLNECKVAVRQRDAMQRAIDELTDRLLKQEAAIERLKQESLLQIAEICHLREKRSA